MSVRRNHKGRAVYADRSYKKGATVERCPVIFIPAREVRRSSILRYYVFELGARDAIVLGCGMLYNHSEKPNVAYALEGSTMKFKALRAIRKDEELVIDYDNGPLLLDARRAKYARGEF